MVQSPGWSNVKPPSDVVNVFQPDGVGDGNRLGDVLDGAGSGGGAPAVALGGTAVPLAEPVAVPLTVPFAVAPDVPPAEVAGAVAVADPGSGGAGGGPQAATSTARQALAATAAPERAVPGRAGPDDRKPGLIDRRMQSSSSS
ncbi:hypothetical protein [Arthrobacter sp. UNC362MFTsu5.1]|uniref:hypothetical protein n=1 Tax=Arthrobacter sp. UNC362MFTsu5.1 TaxID=1449044 RepID=UPI000AA8DC80|nr:hypothetical protein [Arthrobacter sp. UNC362MFTsu5.1]